MTAAQIQDTAGVKRAMTDAEKLEIREAIGITQDATAAAAAATAAAASAGTAVTASDSASAASTAAQASAAAASTSAGAAASSASSAGSASTAATAASGESAASATSASGSAAAATTKAAEALTSATSASTSAATATTKATAAQTSATAAASSATAAAASAATAGAAGTVAAIATTLEAAATGAPADLARIQASVSKGLVITDAAGNKIFPGQATYSPYTADKLLNSSGGMDTSAGWSTSEFISCVPGTTYYVSKARFVAWFNISKALIPSLVDIPLASPPTTLIAPPGAVYFKYTVKTTDISAFRWNPGIVENVVGNYKLNDDVKLPALRSILIGWFKSEAYQITSDITYNAGWKIDTTVAATIEWPNGATGQLYVYYNGDWTVNIVSASYVGDGVRLWVNQPSITYSGGNPFKVPKCTVTAG